MERVLHPDLFGGETEILPDPDLMPEAYAEPGDWPWPEAQDRDPDDDGCCLRCNGAGVIVTCFDDVCVGAGECMHGDGEEICPQCLGGY